MLKDILRLKPATFIKSKLAIVIALTLLFGIMSIVSLRGNYSKMVELREAVIVADQADGDVETALQRLRTHVYTHMNTDLSSGDHSIKPPIQLKARYERLMAAEQSRVANVNDQVNKAAEATCAGQFPAAGFNAERITCIQQYVAAHATKEGEVLDSLYKFDFVSPSWSPDFAGISLLITIALLFLAVIIVLAKIYKRHRV